MRKRRGATGIRARTLGSLFLRGKILGVPLGLTTVLHCVACADETKVQGELGEVEFGYECSDETRDFQCFGKKRGMPASIAVGGRFKLNTDEFGSGAAQIRSASEEMVTKSSDVFTWQREGHAAILLLEHFGEIEDFVHLTGVRVHSLRIVLEKDEDVSRATLLVGERLVFSVLPQSASGDTLGGALDYQWQADDAQFAELRAAGNQVHVEGLSAGSTSIRVMLGEVEASFELSVAPNPDLPVTPMIDAAVDTGQLSDAAAGMTPDAQADAAAHPDAAPTPHPDAAPPFSSLDAGDGGEP